MPKLTQIAEQTKATDVCAEQIILEKKESQHCPNDVIER